jgi:hypothetical protein
MNRNRSRHGGRWPIDWVAATAAVLLGISATLELLAYQFFGQTSIATLFLALYAGLWSSILAVLCIIVMALRWVWIGWSVRANRESADRGAVGGLQHSSLARPDQPGPGDPAVGPVFNESRPRFVAVDEADLRDRLSKAG